MDDKKIAVSIVIPVYNVQNFLSDCLERVVGQTLKETEVILVNDASTDRSLTIMKEYEKQYPDKVHIIDSKYNKGAGGARNLGIENARGEYIGFVDSDDIVDITMFEKMYRKAMEGNYDVVDTGYYKQVDNSAILHTSDECTGILDAEKRKSLIVSGGYVFSKIYRKSLFANQTMRFRNNVILEDADFLTYVYGTVRSIGTVKEVLYYYKNHEMSVSHIKNPKEYYQNIYDAMSAIYKKVSSLDKYHEIREAVEYEMLQMYSYGINVCLKAYLDRKEEEYEILLAKIAELKSQIICGGYENTYVQEKIDALDIAIMQLNDMSSKELLQWADHQAGGMISE